SIGFDLREALGDTMKSLGLRAHAKGLELAYSIDNSISDIVIGDTSRLRQVIVNLVGNAIKFTPDGEVVLRVEQQRRTNNECWLSFSVTDTGIGIPADRINDVFGAFQQADTSTTRSYGGTGLGLAISSRLVEMMGGRIHCQSVVGKGSVFSFTVRFGLISESSQHHLKNPHMVGGTHVLIVDDNATNRRILFEMCSNWGMRPTIAVNAQEGMRLLKQAQTAGTPFLLLLSDVNMPQHDGFALAEWIRADETVSEIPIILLTSSGRPGDADRRRRLNIAANLLKPVKQSDLFDAVVTVLNIDSPEDDVHLPSRSPESDVQVRSLSILLAEDNLVNQKLALGVLGKMGHRVTVADNGQIAVERYRQHVFDIILMDVQMPVMDGFQACAAIRALQRESGLFTPIIAMTAHAMKGDRERCLAGGMDEYLSKPIRSH
ncbi:MAG: response regulator, partial [Planctomycetaceae bacterium]|nr:response regulator [Planctomycetaceae bacterium]